jgi:5-methylcytosine-specific restriction endonuclease McrA
VRDPRPGLVWSGRRIALRARYARYMDSAAWSRHRQDWLQAWAATSHGEPACVVCGEPWTLHHGDLHHRSYRRLGHETPADLIPLCRPCHLRLHALMERAPAWRRLDRAHATDLIVAHLRRRTETHHDRTVQ